MIPRPPGPKNAPPSRLSQDGGASAASEEKRFCPGGQKPGITEPLYFVLMNFAICGC